MSGTAILILAAALYFLPAINAATRRHHNTAAVVCLNIFLGWTLVGWVVALTWSFTRPARA
jgi:Superinfection immunity protein